MTPTRPSLIRRIVYFGTPQTAVPPLEALHAAGYTVDLVVTRPPSRRSRSGDPIPTPVAAAAAELGVNVAVDLCDEAVLRAVSTADLGVLVAYGELIGPEILDRLAMVNLHFSLLPRWRGAAPVEHAILAGDAETGVCLIDVAPDFDEGAVYRQSATPIGAQESADELRARLCGIGVEMLLEALAGGLGEPQPQSGEITLAEKIASSQMRIDWAMPAERIHRLVRVGGAWTTFRSGRLKILQARWQSASSIGGAGSGDAGSGGRAGSGDAGSGGRVVSVDAGGIIVSTGDGLLALQTVQAAGRSIMAAADWQNGARVCIGECLG